jgi:ABC-type histidine transport system ATPase subunit
MSNNLPKLKASSQKVIDAIATAQARTAGAATAQREVVVDICQSNGIKGKSTFLNALTDLKKLKLINVILNGAEIELTDEGSELANTDENAPTTNEEYHEMKKDHDFLFGV